MVEKQLQCVGWVKYRAPQVENLAGKKQWLVHLCPWVTLVITG